MIDSDFFIGWLPVPRTHVPRLRLAVVLTLAFAVGTALALALPQRPPGHASWDEAPTSFEGLLIATPYPMLRTSKDGEIVTLLLVEEGKHGAAQRAAPLDGRMIRATGTLLHRDGRRMLELTLGDEGLQIASLPSEAESRLRAVTVECLGKVTVQGELVDSKCHLGAMKPGEGRPHRGCALLCLQGGVPPIFRTRDNRLLLLTSPDGRSLDPRHFQLAGVASIANGTLTRCGDLDTLTVESLNADDRP
jgi:hypothetical protein